jgi:hypothetical protein
MYDLILIEILAVPAEHSRGRSNPRAVKRKMSKFPTTCRATTGAAGQPALRYSDHIRIIAPPEPVRQKPPPPTAVSKAHTKPTSRRDCLPADHQETWKHHVQAWHNSGQSRATYCQEYDLDERTFHQWVARLRHTFLKSCKAKKNTSSLT